MSTIVNLRHVRKQKARAEKEAAAEANRIKHGQPKALLKKLKAQSELEARRTDAHKLEE